MSLDFWTKFIPTGNYMFKVNNRNTRTRCEICSKLAIKTPERHHWRLRAGKCQPGYVIHFLTSTTMLLLIVQTNLFFPMGRESIEFIFISNSIEILQHLKKSYWTTNWLLIFCCLCKHVYNNFVIFLETIYHHLCERTSIYKKN